MGVLLGIGGTLIGLFLLLGLGLLVVPFVVHFAAKISGVENPTFARAFISSVISMTLSIVITPLFSIVPIIGTLVGLFVSIFLNLIILKNVYETGWGKALHILIMQWLVSVLIVLILYVLL